MAGIQSFGPVLQPNEVHAHICMLDVGAGDCFVVDVRDESIAAQAAQRTSWSRHIIDAGSLDEKLPAAGGDITRTFYSRPRGLNEILTTVMPIPLQPAIPPAISTVTITHADRDHAGNGARLLKDLDIWDSNNWQAAAGPNPAAPGPNTFRPQADGAPGIHEETRLFSFPRLGYHESAFEIVAENSADPFAEDDVLGFWTGLFRVRPTGELVKAMNLAELGIRVAEVKHTLVPLAAGEVAPEVWSDTGDHDPGNTEQVFRVYTEDDKARHKIKSITCILWLTDSNAPHEDLGPRASLWKVNALNKPPRAIVGMPRNAIVPTGKRNVDDIEEIDKTIDAQRNAVAARLRPELFRHVYLTDIRNAGTPPDIFFNDLSLARTGVNDLFRDSKLWVPTSPTVKAYFRTLLIFRQLLVNDVANHSSLMQYFKNSLHTEFEMLFTGDAYFLNDDRRDAALLHRLNKEHPKGRAVKEVAVLKVPHHGSKSTELDFFNRVRARVYLFSSSNPKHSHPSNEVLKAIIKSIEGTEIPGQRGVPRVFLFTPDALRSHTSPGFDVTIDGAQRVMSILWDNSARNPHVSTYDSRHPNQHGARHYRAFYFRPMYNSYAAKETDNDTNLARHGRLRIGVQNAQLSVEMNLPGNQQNPDGTSTWVEITHAPAVDL